ncbi:hypothetical protein LRR18_17650, partial [Mangrovimonas sp. AS39]|uniref:hypothetical protein n=1 Tax=Mangrovimonas futianensis TaxID=2895523 RepID=UPI001E322995
AGSFGGYQPVAAGDKKAAEEARAVLNLASAWDYLGASMGGTVGRMAQSASDIGSIVTQSVGALTGALGAAATNMIIAGDAGGKALKKQAGNALAGISA